MNPGEQIAGVSARTTDPGVAAHRKKAAAAGVLILAAYAMLAAEATDQGWLVMLVDLVSGLAVIGVAFTLFPFFKSLGTGLSGGYLGLKILEGTLMAAAGAFALAGRMDWRDWIYEWPQVFEFTVSASLFYYLLLRTRLVPRFISIWGLVACGALLAADLAKVSGQSYPVLDALLVLMITNEVFLAIWLMTRGLRTARN